MGLCFTILISFGLLQPANASEWTEKDFSTTLADESNNLQNVPLKELSEEEMQYLISELKKIYVDQNIIQNELVGIGQDQIIETYGVKSKAALKVADMLLKSGNKTVDILHKLGLLDKASAKSFKSVTGKVGKYVKTLGNAGDSAAAMAKSQLPGKLKSWGVTNKGTQQMIANSVSYAIKAANWIFL